MIKRSNKKAFTLLELLFVIVIIGIMVGIGSSAFKPKYLIDDTNFIVSKIKEARYKGIGFEHLNIGGGVITGYDDLGCITFTKDSLEENATNTAEVNYRIHVEFSGDLAGDTICFDSKGHPRQNSFSGSLLPSASKLELEYSGDKKTIIIEPITGYSYILNN